MEKPPNAAPESEHQEVTARETRAAAAEEYLQQGQAPYGKTGLKGTFTNKYVTVCAAFATLGGGLFGYDQGMMSVTLTMEHFIASFPQASPDAAGSGFQKGILTAIFELGALFGAMNAGWIADKISRKWSLFVAVLVFLLGSAIQTGSINYDMLIGGRFVGGIAVGMLAMVAPLYISEVAPPEIRGTLLAMQELAIVTAIVIAFFITYGTRFIDSEWSWRLPFLLQIVPALFLGAGSPFLPYSPRWLVSKDRGDEALGAICKLRGIGDADERVLHEWATIRSEVAYRKQISVEQHPRLQHPRYRNRVLLEILGYLDCFRKGCLERTLVGIGLMFFQQFSGVNALIYYSPSLFKGMGLDYEMQLDMSGVLNICQMVACFWSLWATDQFGRRPLLLYGGLGMMVAQFIVAILVSQFSENWPAHQGGAWASVAMLFVYMLTYGGTWGPIPWSMPAEIFPSSLRAKGVSYATMSNWLNNFIIGLITPPLLQNTGYGTYLFFGVFCLLSLVWVWFFVPETSGKTLEEMDQVFHSNTGQSERESRARIETEIARSVWNSHAAKQQAA